MVRQTLREDSSLPTSPNSTSDQTSSTNIDPFLGGDTDFHSRQESGDSGLGLSTNYSLPNTPEDYLMGMDEGNGAEGIVSCSQIVVILISHFLQNFYASAC